MGIIGLDLSLTSTGMCRMGTLGGPENFTTRVIATKPDQLIYARQEQILLELNFVGGDNIFLEDYAAFTSSSFGMTAALHGLVRFMIFKKTGSPPVLVSPTTLKKWITGSGAGKKEDVKLAIYKKYGFEFKTSDEADAFALADFGWHLSKMPPRRTLFKWEEEMLTAFLKPKKT
jgi:crossover junction endodeoxyribonuclease RuvC